MKKLTVKKETTQIKKQSSAQFKKPSCALYKARVATVLRKAFQLSELCGVELRVIWFDREGNLVKTTPGNEEAKVRAMAERFSTSKHERNKKSTNLSEFLNKKIMDDKRESLKKKDNKFSGKVSEFMYSLRSRFQLYQESLLLLDQQQPKETNSVVSPSTTTMSLSNFLILDQESLLHLDQHQPKETTSGVVPTDLSSNLPSKFSILLYNHDNGAFTKLANNSSGFEQSSSFNQDYGSNYLDSLLGEEQGMMTMTCCNNFDIPLPFCNTFHQFDHHHQFMQQTQQPVYHYAVE